ncbi:CerR family C-terminal domain-containing protein [Novosphingobium sp. KCTC 2891]|uniref:TetR/AcrR family transcriptional regulator n=1 Tax=Novosphingobium sp. KCTC 2891 TaxID=2989730 RepID=UPI00222168C6|nr:TetR family transcriptional regulator [Novosphingobium sp. KCTC 2891]MCW1384117.1 CerR family C-terminal domain-containing protein [Novosphingobium sp. KCTC 2891]
MTQSPFANLSDAAAATASGAEGIPGNEHANETTAQRILRTGMACFAREGFAGATTRMIASAAGVTLPVIAYHFGNKDGLHRACAHEIVEQHRRRLLPLVAAARTAADEGALSPQDARAWLERILTALVEAITADADQRLATDFVLREMSEQGPGYDLLYDKLWMPGIGLVADLLALARGQARAGEDERIGALMLLASLSAFTREEPVARAFLGWDSLEDGRRHAIARAAHRLLAGLLIA